VKLKSSGLVKNALFIFTLRNASYGPGSSIHLAGGQFSNRKSVKQNDQSLVLHKIKHGKASLKRARVDSGVIKSGDTGPGEGSGERDAGGVEGIFVVTYLPVADLEKAIYNFVRSYPVEHTVVTKHWLVALIRCIAIALLGTFSLTTCTTLKGYPGPELSAEQLAIVSRSFFQRGSLSVDDQDLNIWNTKIAVLPGEHKVELYFSELLEERTIGPEHCTTSISTCKKDNKEQYKTHYSCEYPVEVTQRAVWCIAEFVTEPKREYRVEYSDFKIVIHELNDNRIVTNQGCETGLPITRVETRSRTYDRDGCNYSTPPFCL
jgi:hypothetical protein